MQYARSLAAGISFSLACAFAGEADALERGQCMPTAQMVAAFKAEGHRDVIWADKLTEDEKSRPLYVITMDDDGNALELVGNRFFNGKGNPAADHDWGIPAELCVRAKMTNARLSDAYASAQSGTTPESFYVPGDLTPAEVTKISQELGIGGSTDHNGMLRRAPETGIFPAFQATLDTKGANDNLRLTVMMDTKDNKLGTVNNSAPNGFAFRTDILQNARYTEAGIDVLRQGVRVASLSPQQ